MFRRLTSRGARFPLIDFHTHITMSTGPGRIKFDMEPANCLAVMDRKNIRTMVNVTGGYGDGLREAVAKLSQPHPGRFVVFTEPAWTRASDPGLSQVSGRPDRRRPQGRRQGAQDFEDARPFPARAGHQQARPHRRSALRPHVGGGRRAENAGGHPHLRSGGFLPADRPLQRALGGVARPSRLVFPRKRLSRATASFRRRGATSCGATRTRSLSASTPPTPRTWRMFPNAWTAIRI